MKHAETPRLVFFILFAMLQSCSGLNSECSDGIDNDGDGLVDTFDPACQRLTDLPARCQDPLDGLQVSDPACSQSQSGAYEAADPICANRKDDDGDGRIDQDDPGCQNHLGQYTPNAMTETNPQCSDGIDNDGDGFIDHLTDPGCGGMASGRAENIDPPCADGRDNDGDGNIDYPQDPGCDGPFDTTENNPECFDGIDNDGDGLIDVGGLDTNGDGVANTPLDPGCDSPQDTDETDGVLPACSDGIDNDGDGAADYPSDPDCESESDPDEAPDGECSDGIDNDGDGLTDYTTQTSPGDPACDAGLGAESPDPVCADGIDNDGDGRADFAGVDLNNDSVYDLPGEIPPDPGCLTAVDLFESTKPQCSDGIDNDGDGTTDYPADAACAHQADSDIDGLRGRNEGSPSQCSDGIDNDGDGLIDFEPEFLSNGSANPDFSNGDPQCTGLFDNGEAL